MKQVYAQVDLLGSDFPSFTKFNTFGDVVNVIVRNGMVIAGVITLLILVLGGFRYIMAAGGGDAKQMESGKKAITGAIIGLVLIIFAVWIVQIIKALTGFDFIAPQNEGAHG